MKTVKLVLTSDEIWPLLNIFNEICRGLYIKNFEDVIGAKEQEVIALSEKISLEEDKSIAHLCLNEFELNILNNSFSEVLRQIEKWEFQTRIGIYIEDAIKIKNKINEQFVLKNNHVL